MAENTRFINKTIHLEKPKSLMEYNWAKMIMSELRSVYYFDKEEDFHNAVDSLQHHLGYYSTSNYDYFSSTLEVHIYEGCPDIVKAASICKEHGGKFRNPR